LKNIKFSVLMSVYYKENPNNLFESLKSITSKQTIIPNQIVIVKDGPLNEGLDRVINDFSEEFKEIFTVVDLKENVGLGAALRLGMEHCRNDYIARMDSDDISQPNRFERQIDYLLENPNVDLVGSYIAEFENNSSNLISVRKVPQTCKEVYEMAKTRSPVNHVTAFFKKSSVVSSGGYIGGEPVEDYDLWIRMILNGKIIENIPEVLVHVRVGEGMYKRRGNKTYIRSWVNIQKKMLNKKHITPSKFLINSVMIFAFIYMPPSLKKFAYRNFLRQA
jgi:glycosyltransferase involved in cell wall biosynthesis